MKDRTIERMRIRSVMEVVFPEYLQCIDVCTESSLYLLSKYFLPDHFLNVHLVEDEREIKRISRNNYDVNLLIKLQQLAKESIGTDRKDEEDVLRLTLDSYILVYKQMRQLQKS